MSRPRFVPAIHPSQIDHGPERHVAQSLEKTLDEEWIVFHSYSWLRTQKNHPKAKAALQEGEVDFLLLHRSYGLLVLEVKGGRISYDGATGQWWQNNHPLSDPFKQAQRNMHALLDQVRQRGKFTRRGPMPCSFGYSVIFPDSVFSGEIPPGGHAAIIFSSKDCKTLGEGVVKAMRHWSRQNEMEEMHASDFEELKKALLGNFRIVSSLARDVQRDEDMLIQLTEQQSEALESIYTNERVLIEGTAGSGKTLLALQRAQAFAAEGQSVLFLCYNRMLAAWLQRRTKGLDGVKVANFHALCHELVEKAGFPWNPPAGADKDAVTRFWHEIAPEMLLDATDEIDERYDAIIVDEGQDFRDHWWTAIEGLHKNPLGPLYIFFDRAQNLYQTELNFPKCATRYNLRTNCRNTRKIATACESLLGHPIKVSRFTPEGAPPLVIPYSDDTQVRRACTNVLKKVIGEEGISAAKVAILGPYTLNKSGLGGNRLGKYQLLDNVADWQKGKGVWYSTIRSFKGLEADVLVLIDIGDFQEGFFERHDLFVACTRARHRLIVYTMSQQVEAMLRTQVAEAG